MLPAIFRFVIQKYVLSFPNLRLAEMSETLERCSIQQLLVSSRLGSKGKLIFLHVTTTRSML